MTPTLVKAIHERFPHQVATDLIAWLEGAFQPAKVLARPPRSVREVLGEDLVDELMDVIIAVHGRPRLSTVTPPPHLVSRLNHHHPGDP